MLVFDLRIQSDREKIALTKKFVPTNEIQAAAEIVRIKHFDSLPEILGKKFAMFEIAVEPKRSGIKLNLAGSNAQLVRQPNVIPIFVPILRNREWVGLRGRVFHF